LNVFILTDSILTYRLIAIIYEIQYISQMATALFARNHLLFRFWITFLHICGSILSMTRRILSLSYRRWFADCLHLIFHVTSKNYPLASNRTILATNWHRFERILPLNFDRNKVSLAVWHVALSCWNHILSKFISINSGHKKVVYHRAVAFAVHRLVVFIFRKVNVFSWTTWTKHAQASVHFVQIQFPRIYALYCEFSLLQLCGPRKSWI